MSVPDPMAGMGVIGGGLMPPYTTVDTPGPLADLPNALREQFHARVTAAVSPPHADGTTAAKLGFQEQTPNPDTGGYDDRTDGRTGDGVTVWAVGISGNTYAAGDTVMLQRHRCHADRFEVVATSGGGTGGMVPILTTAANNGSQWTPALVQAFTTTGGTTNTTPPETVDVQPLGGTLNAGELYYARDTGARSTGTNYRRLRVERAGGGGRPPAQVSIPVTTYVCNNGYLQPTTVTYVLEADGLRQVSP